MVIWVDKDAVRAKTNQRALVVDVNNKNIHVQLLGTDEDFIIQPRHVFGVEISENLAIKFKYVGHVVRTGDFRLTSANHMIDLSS